MHCIYEVIHIRCALWVSVIIKAFVTVFLYRIHGNGPGIICVIAQSEIVYVVVVHYSLLISLIFHNL